mmetsp:Transcript_4308/g.4821  ORF Transcript_4308/g.4821 Transcript_4308/m.4821 type:complete len:491 (-) Transcript_4308:417-1889(-)|eukprot:CAMPEP_0114977806 /NCGR_PEP_ID=MMETSP0216-20121206/3448_1 /TAXON_ID=223996 /ORGANISM="Protocruzia adherens, Strain Boccale" /LENGTH=490 /DNA_ID=CAMNT_0002338917 /DNA_START=143 /DNA_END=1615 /DNA_ORIENTATION=+
MELETSNKFVTPQKTYSRFSTGSSDSVGSKSKKTPLKEQCGDRFIPSRTSLNLFSTYGDCTENATEREQKKSAEFPKDEGLNTYNQLLRSQVLGIRSCNDKIVERFDEQSLSSAGSTPASAGKSFSPSILKYKPDHTSYATSPYALSPLGGFDLDHFGPIQTPRKIPKVPFKVLDAPNLQDDFYLNLVDWSSLNVLSVGLGSSVYLWSACTSKVTKLCELGPTDSVTSVGWSNRGTHLAVGTNNGEVQVWDAARLSKVRTFEGHNARVGTLAWNSNLLSSGSRDRNIFQRDVRAPESFLCKLSGHKQEVCGLKWSFDGQSLASGGNDNKLLVWNMHSTSPVTKFTSHTAAVKAIAWSPHQHGLLASGGGTADRCIRFWNTLTSSQLYSVDTGSQVCNLLFSKNVNEVVSTHGYSLNQIIVWKYPSMQKVITLTGHTYRVLYLAMSPDGESIVTGAGDETLRFWNVFPSRKNKNETGSRRSTLFLSNKDIR